MTTNYIGELADALDVPEAQWERLISDVSAMRLDMKQLRDAWRANDGTQILALGMTPELREFFDIAAEVFSD